MEAFRMFRSEHRRAVLKTQSQPNYRKDTTKRVKFSGSYSDIVNGPSQPQAPLQATTTTGLMLYLPDYDALP